MTTTTDHSSEEFEEQAVAEVSDLATAEIVRTYHGTLVANLRHMTE
jgi:hypothetical protein